MGGPRRRPSATTRTVRRHPPCGSTTMSPIRRRWLAFLTGKPLTATAPAAHSRDASDRLLTKRANHSHWSRRVLGGSPPPPITLQRILGPPALHTEGRLAG